jgi:hypothetical protein
LLVIGERGDSHVCRLREETDDGAIEPTKRGDHPLEPPLVNNRWDD